MNKTAWALGSSESVNSGSAAGHRELLLTMKCSVRDSNGNLLGVLGIGRNITQMHELNERFTVAFNASPAAISLTSPDCGTFLDINPKFESLLGYARTTLIGSGTLALDMWQDPAARKHLLGQLLKSGSVKDQLVYWRKSAFIRRPPEYKAFLVNIEKA